MPEYILGLSAYYHDSAAALIRDGEIVAAEGVPAAAASICITARLLSTGGLAADVV